MYRIACQANNIGGDLIEMLAMCALSVLEFTQTCISRSLERLELREQGKAIFLDLADALLQVLVAITEGCPQCNRRRRAMRCASIPEKMETGSTRAAIHR